MRAVLIKFCLAVGSLVFIIAGASDIRGIVTMGASTLASLSRTGSVSTLCSTTVWGERMVFIALARCLIRRLPLVVPVANVDVVCNSSVSAFSCALLLRFGI
jgi:hypothetical protein